LLSLSVIMVAAGLARAEDRFAVVSPTCERRAEAVAVADVGRRLGWRSRVRKHIERDDGRLWVVRFGPFDSSTAALFAAQEISSQSGMPHWVSVIGGGGRPSSVEIVDEAWTGDEGLREVLRRVHVEQQQQDLESVLSSSGDVLFRFIRGLEGGGRVEHTYVSGRGCVSVVLVEGGTRTGFVGCENEAWALKPGTPPAAREPARLADLMDRFSPSAVLMPLLAVRTRLREVDWEVVNVLQQAGGTVKIEIEADEPAAPMSARFDLATAQLVEFVVDSGSHRFSRSLEGLIDDVRGVPVRMVTLKDGFWTDEIEIVELKVGTNRDPEAIARSLLDGG
jgi:hypothetical protein